MNITPNYVLLRLEKSRRSKFEEIDLLCLHNLQIFKAQRNVILCVSVFLLYWSIYRICKINKDIKSLEEIEKRIKEE